MANTKEETTTKTTAKAKPASATPKRKTTTTTSTAKVAKKPAKKTAGAPVAHGVGRRKSSVARVWLRKGTGAIKVNDRDYADYFSTEVARLEAKEVFVAISDASQYDLSVNVSGGGVNSQAGALKLGMARALITIDEAYRPILRAEGLLTVDSRLKERKKYGQKAARRKFQFVKR